MRITGLLVISPAHLPPSESAAIAERIDAAAHERRRNIDHHGIAIEGHLAGFFVNTAMVLEDPRPAEVSTELWVILSRAEHQGCDWVLFDWDEPFAPELPDFG